MAVDEVDEEDTVASDVSEAVEVAPEAEAAAVMLVVAVSEADPLTAAPDPDAEAEAAPLVGLAAEAVVVVLLAGPVLLLTRGKRGVKLYPSGPTLETFEAGPMIISMA